MIDRYGSNIPEPALRREVRPARRPPTIELIAIHTAGVSLWLWAASMMW